MIDRTTAASDFEYAKLDDVLLDTGSAITLLGGHLAQQWIRKGYARTVKPLASSTRAIRGIGALNHVQFWVAVTVDIGGVFVTFMDVPVIKEHEGFLVGNDFLGKGGADVQYKDSTSGTLTLWDRARASAISVPVGFRTVAAIPPLASFVRTQGHRRLRRRTRARRSSKRRCDVESSADSAYETDCDESNNATDFGEISAEERAERMAELDKAGELEAAIRDVKPIGWTPETVIVPAWSEVYFKIRVPASLVKAREVVLLPLEDERQADLGVLIAPTIQKVSEDGYAMCRAINMQKRKVRIPLLTPVVRFHVDPRVYHVSYEYTVEEIMEKINVGEDLSVSELDQIRNLVSTRRALFASKLGYAHATKMSIRVKPGSKPPNATLRLRTPEERAALKKEVDKQLKAGLVEPCRSPYGALPMLIKKPTKEGEPQAWRVVLDYRGCNAILDGVDAYRLPNMSANLSALGKANWYSTCDLLQGFHQVELADDGISKEITSFNTEDGQFQYVRMPMGLASSPSTFMRIVDATLRGLPPGIALAYADDICIPTCGTFEDHMRDVGLVFDRLIEGGFTVRCDKMFIGRREVPYLGFMVGAYGMRPLPEKTQAIFDIALNDMIGNPAVAGRYAGMLGFYSKFIKDSQTLLGPFHDLKGKAAPVARIAGDANNVPSLRFIAAFHASRNALAEITALCRPDTTQPFYIYVDAASSCGIGGVLMQREDPDDPESLKPIEFWSRRLIDEERGYSARDQECLALHEALKQWRHYIRNSKIELLSDHSSLQWLLSTPHRDDTRVSGWALYAQDFDINIRFIPGSENIVADFFSRHAKRTEPAQEQGPTGSRPSIADRLDDSTCTVSTQCGGQLPAAVPAPNEDALSDADTDLEGAGDEQRDTTVRQATRAALVVLRRGKTGEVEALVETGMSASVFPAVATDVSAAHFRYRDQLAAALRWDYSPQVGELIRSALPFRRRRALSDCQYFVAVAPHDLVVSSPSTRDANFQPITDQLLAELTDDDDSAFIRVVARELQLPGVNTELAYNKWVGHLRRIAPRMNAPVAAAAESLPTIADAPCGPAFCASEADGALAIERIHRRLMDNPGLSMALDLEGPLGGRRGHIELMQIAVDPVNARQKRLVYVFDTEHMGSKFLGTGCLRNILEDGGVPKVVHCSYGDAAVLYNEYGIILRGGFDTGVADCVIRQVGLNRQRRLDKVVADYVDGGVLQHKGDFEHKPGMFARRPLPRLFFEYAYEDVIHCNELYVKMRQTLERMHMTSLVSSLSAMRAPPLALKSAHALFEQPRELVVIVRDTTRLLCLQDKTSGAVSLPAAAYDINQPDDKQQAQHVWAKHMGKAMTGQLANRMRKATRIGHTLIFEAHVPDCTQLMASLQTAQELMGEGRGDVQIVSRAIHSPDMMCQGHITQAVVFQYLRWQEPEACNVVVGRTIEKTRVAIVLYNESHVYALTTAKNGVLQFPSCPLEIGAEPADMAAKAFDLFAGTALRKKGDGAVLLPVTSKAVHKSFESIKEIVSTGNTTYFGCHMPDLHSYVSAFYAARRPVNGFRLTPTLHKRHPDFTICPWSVAARLLDADNDAAVVSALKPVIGEIATERVQTPPASQHSGQDASNVADEYSLSDADTELFDWSDFMASHSAIDDDLSPTVSSGPPPVDSDPEYDALFEAAVLVRYSAFMATPVVADVAAGSIGSPPQKSPPSAADIAAEQAAHPATRELVSYLQVGELSDAFGRLTATEQSAFSKRATHYFLDGDNVLRRVDDCNRQPNTEGLVVLPPRFRSFFMHQCHDRSCHFGVEKTLGLVRRRFYWGSVEFMRAEVARYIKHCHVCQVAKVPVHAAGEAQIGFCGNYPWEVICGDMYYAGISEDGYDKTIDFACFFSRQIKSEPVQGDPDANCVCDVLLNTVIRNYGVPSEVRSDAGKNFIAAGVRALYDRMGIKMTVGTAYHHQLVALVERWHRTLGQLLKVHTAAKEKAGWGNKWYRCVPLMELVYNNTVNPSTTYTPFFMNHFRHARLPSDVLRACQPELPKELPSWVQERLDELNVVYDAAARSLRLKAISAKRRYDLRHEVNLWFKPGDRVLLVKGSVTDKSAIKSKAQIPMEGPFTVSKALSNDRYLLTDLRSRRIRDVVHVSRLVPYFAEVACDDPTWMVDSSPSGGKWPVLDVVGRRIRTLSRAAADLGLAAGSQVVEYKIRWVGFDRDSDTWRPVQTLADVIDLVNSYDSRNPPTVEPGEGLAFVPRAPQGSVEPSDEARKRAHMRAVPHKGELRPSVEDGSSFIPTELPQEKERAAEQVEPSVDPREQRRLERARQKELRTAASLQSQPPQESPPPSLPPSPPSSEAGDDYLTQNVSMDPFDYDHLSVPGTDVDDPALESGSDGEEGCSEVAPVPQRAAQSEAGPPTATASTSLRLRGDGASGHASHDFGTEGDYSLGHLPLPPNWSLSYAHFSPDLLYDLFDGTPDTSFGRIWRDVGKTNLELGHADPLKFLGMEKALMCLHARAAWMGFRVRLVREEHQVARGWGYRTHRTYVIYFSHASLPQRHITISGGDGRRMLMAAVQVHAEMEDVFKALTPPVTLAFRKWPRLVDDHGAQISPQPDLLDHEPTTAQHAYASSCEAVLDEARSSKPDAPRFIALDVEDGGNSCAVVQLGVHLSSGYLVVLETAPFPTLRQVLLTDCVILVFGADERAWLSARDLLVPPPRAQLLDYQSRCLRQDDRLAEDNRDQYDDREYRDRRIRNLPEALALHRCDPRCVYLKERDGKRFHWPNGLDQPSIWASRPLQTEHIKYAAADVVALLLMNSLRPTPVTGPSSSSFLPYQDSHEHTLPPSTGQPANESPAELPIDTASVYQGFASINQEVVFNTLESQVSVFRLRTIACQSWHAFEVSSDCAPAQQRANGTDVTWMKQCGALRAPAHLAIWEVTIPAETLQPSACAEIGRQFSYQGRPARGRLLHYKQMQRLAATLAADALVHLRALHDGDPGDLMYLGAQFTAGVQGSHREPHVDPPKVAEALATLSLTGSADITLKAVCSNPPPDHVVKCSAGAVYMLTGPSVRDTTKHGVVVTSPLRISLTLRFASRWVLGLDD